MWMRAVPLTSPIKMLASWSRIGWLARSAVSLILGYMRPAHQKCMTTHCQRMIAWHHDDPKAKIQDIRKPSLRHDCLFFVRRFSTHRRPLPDRWHKTAVSRRRKDPEKAILASYMYCDSYSCSAGRLLTKIM